MLADKKSTNLDNKIAKYLGLFLSTYPRHIIIPISFFKIKE